jgi:LuxR family maltose regulon positive regulatory protein
MVVETKLHPPLLREGSVPRPHLVRRLEATGAKLVLVAAPVGYGKTTLLAEWRARAGPGRAFAWVSLDAGDDDPVLFWACIVEAIRRVRPSFGQRILAALRSPGTDLQEAVLPRLVGELAALPGRLSLVLDDYHRVRSARSHELLSALVERLPVNIQVVLASRVDPPLALGRLRAQGELAEVRTADLRFTAPDAGALLAGSLPAALDEQSLAALVKRTEGWAGGLYLAALALRGQPDPRRFVRDFSGSHRHLAEYLSDEVLASLDPGVRHFLARTSILERFCASLCAAVAGTDDAAVILEQLERSNLFLVPLDEERVWYRYHHLFADLLKSNLARSEPGRLPELHRRASEWHCQHGTVDEAIHHAVVGNDQAGAARLIGSSWFRHVNAGRLASVQRWLRELGDEALAADPGMALTAACVATLAGERETRERWLAVAERAVGGAVAGSVAGGFQSFESGVALLRAFGFEGLEAALAAARRAVELETDPASPWRATALLLLGWLLYLTGDAAAARAPLEAAARFGHYGAPLIFVSATPGLSLIAGDQRRREEAMRLAREACRVVDEFGLSETPQSSIACGAMGRALAGEGRLAEARVELERAVRLRRAAPGLSPWQTILFQLFQASVCHALGDQPAAQTLVAAARQLLEAYPEARWLREQYRQLAAEVGRPPRRWVQQGQPLSEAELDVLRLLPGPQSLRQIGQQLFLSVDTIRSHARAIYRKLGVGSRAEAVAGARRAGLL